MKCPKCGGHMEETDKRCPYCNSYNENYKKPKPPIPQQQRPQANNTANKKPEEQGPGCLTEIAGIIIIGFFILLFVAFAKSCSSCNSSKKGYADSEISKQVEITDATTTSGIFSRRLEKYAALIN